MRCIDMSHRERLIQRWFEELINGNDWSVADEILTADVTYYGPRSMSPREVSSREDLKKFLQHYHDAFPDVEYTIEHRIDAGDEVCVRWRAEGTHEQELFGITGRGETFSDHGFSTFAIENDKISEVWSVWDTLGMVQELNLVSPLGIAASNTR